MAFATFPEFTTLTWAHKDEYQALIKDYPPIADISFVALMGWWGVNKSPDVAMLNGNLVIAYYSQLDFDIVNFCVIGTNNIDESICTLYDYFIEKGHVPRLTHVPEFVISNIRYPELFNFKAERDYDEYIVDLSKYASLGNMGRFQKLRVEQFIDKMHGHNVSVEPLDLSSPEAKRLLLDATERWPKKGINKENEHERQAIVHCINNADKMGLKNACLKIDGEIHCFMLFDAPQNQDYVTLEYARLSYGLNNIANFSIHMFSEWLATKDVKYMNVSMDYGKPVLRIAKLALNPINFFRKYSIEPQKQPAISGANISY